MPEPETDLLTLMLQKQLELQVNSYEVNPALLEGEERSHFILWNAYALTDEIHEALNEVGWKPWASSRHLNREEYVGELVDAWHFFMNLLIVARVQPEEFFNRYLQKRAVNATRQEEGYDGIKGKCRACKRDLAEVGVTAVMIAEQREPIGHHCNGCGARVVEDPHAAAAAEEA